MAWAPDYCTAEELAEFISVQDDLDDAVMARAITAASRAIDQETGRQFGLVDVAEARYYTARYDLGSARWVADIDDLMATPVSVGYDDARDNTYSTAITGGIYVPRNAASMGRPWTQLQLLPGATSTLGTFPDGVRVTARWGWTTVPTTIVEATLLQSSRLVQRRYSPYGVAGSLRDGSELRLMSKLDPDVVVSVRPYRRVWGAR